MTLLRTEYSFRAAFGKVQAAVARCGPAACITDPGTWGHIEFHAACRATGRKPLLGTRAALVRDLSERPTPGAEVVLIPRSATGLTEVYRLAALASEQTYYLPRLLPAQLPDPREVFTVAPAALSLPGAVPSYRLPSDRPASGLAVWTNDPLYPSPGDRETWAMMLGKLARHAPHPQHIHSPDELSAADMAGFTALASECDDLALPKAQNIRFGVPDPDAELRSLVMSGMARRGLRDHPVYRERVERELKLIAEKSFADYFLVISDLIRWAKERMLVGPARGSSAGSAVCWFTDITTLDPIKWDLIFERFIDVTRYDLPDIDIDFPDKGRADVIAYLQKKYGVENFAHIGTVARYKPRSALDDVAREIGIPLFELNAFKDTIIERSSGDSRVNDCLADSLAANDAGRGLLQKYPQLEIACRLEGHARQSGKHAAGLIVCNAPVRNYCGVARDSVAMIEKKGAEKLNMLKIDALGLRTLSVLADGLAAAKLPLNHLYDVEENELRAFDILNDHKYAGIFQFEGLALQGVATQTLVHHVNDIASLTALARPGPLGSGATTAWIAKKRGESVESAMDPAIEELTRDTHGEIIYQEQVMRITREIGNFSWADTAKIRKLMSNRTGDEAFQKFEELFLTGATANGIPPVRAKRLWDAINTFGSWAFNKSHAVAYGMLSYWCCWMKAIHPTAFALGALMNAKDDDSTMALLRELVRDGIKYVPLDEQRSAADWSVKDGELIGGFTGVKGIGMKTALTMCIMRDNGIPWKKRHRDLLLNGSKWADPFPVRSRFGKLLDKEHRVTDDATKKEIFRGGITPLVQISEHDTGKKFLVIGKLLNKRTRNLNEAVNLARRGGRRAPEDRAEFLLFDVEDDTARIIVKITAWDFPRIGKPVLDTYAEGDWVAVVGEIRGNFRMLTALKVKRLKEKG